MNYGSQHAKSRNLEVNDVLALDFHLDYLAIVGKPLCVLTSSDHDGLLDSFEFSYHNWNQPYQAQIADQLHFSLKHRTFQFEIGPSREKWYLVLHPFWNEETEEDPRQRDQNHKRDARQSALSYQDALTLIAWFAEIFQSGNLINTGVTDEWRLKSPRKTSLSYQQWREFQEILCNEWEEFSNRYPESSIWQSSQPAFHLWDYGRDIEFKASDISVLFPHTPSADDEELQGKICLLRGQYLLLIMSRQ